MRWGDRRAVVRNMLFRTGYANLRANKYEGRQAWCNLCDMKEAETEAHVLLRCPSFVAQRAELLHDLGQVWNADKLNRWSSLQDTDRVAAILSNEAEHRDTERAVDSAIKRMLTKIEDARVQAGTHKFGGFGSDEEVSVLSSEEEDLDEELIRMGEEVVDQGRTHQTKTPCGKKNCNRRPG